MLADLVQCRCLGAGEGHGEGKGGVLGWGEGRQRAPTFKYAEVPQYMNWVDELGSQRWVGSRRFNREGNKTKAKLIC